MKKDRDSGSLPSKVAIALLGIHLRSAMPLAGRPSDMDVQLLKDLYGTYTCTATFNLLVIVISVPPHRKHKFHHPWTAIPAPKQSTAEKCEQSRE